jgi:lipoprotein-anchoring transpeptidase ErfK/SrfK
VTTSGTGRHVRAPIPRSRTRLDTTAAVAVLVAVTGIIAAVIAGNKGSAKPTAQPAPESAARARAASALSTRPREAASLPRAAAAASAASAPRKTSAAPPAHDAAVPLVLTAADRRACPATATACVDLTRHITWLQANGKTTFGPVQMEPGRPGGGHETPRGVFRVEWKAGPSYVSNIYHEPMPWATFFAAGGIAFHGGSLTAWSHGCVHLTDSNAHYFNEHLPVGAQVVVF